jgi:DNA-binding Lrp family transcriptional regulator
MWKQKVHLPTNIARTLKGLKEEYGVYITARKIKGRYYFYKEWNLWDPEAKKQRLKSEYIGKADNNGAFQKSEKGYKLNLENAARLIESIGGKVILPSTKGGQQLKVDETDRKILTCLSMNARLPAKRVGQIAGLASSTAYARIKALEEKYGLEYVTQFFMPPLGYRVFMILIKFTDDRPGVEQLRLAFAREPKIQYAVLTKGEYDILAYLVDESSTQAEVTVLNLRSSTVIGNYRAVVYTSPVAQRYGYVKMRDEFFANTLKGKVWHRTRKETGGSPVLFQREFDVLHELSANGMAAFPQIDRKHDLGKGASAYTYKKLRASGIIRTTTINMRLTNSLYMGIIFIKRLLISNYTKTRHLFYQDVVRETADVMNKYALICEVAAPDSIIIFAPIRSGESIEEIADALAAKLKGVEIATSIVINQLVGHLCLRRFDNKYAIYSEELASIDGNTVQNKIRYDD